MVPGDRHGRCGSCARSAPARPAGDRPGVRSARSSCPSSHGLVEVTLGSANVLA